MNELDQMNWQMMMQWGDIGFMFQILAWVGIAMNIFIVVAFLLKAWGLYNINKKLWEDYPWLAWIPVIQIYSFVKAAWKNWIWILWLILGLIAFVIPWIIILAILCNGIAKRTGRWFWSALWIFFFSSIMLPIIGYKLKEKWIAETSNTPVEEKREL